MTAAINVLVTMPFSDAQLDRLRAVSPSLHVVQEPADLADFKEVDILYSDMPPRDRALMSRWKWAQLHLAGINALHDHPVFTESDIPLTTTSGVHAATAAEYAITMMLALAHRVPRMVEWQARGKWPPDEQRWPLFVPVELRGARLGIIGYGSIGREVARIAKAAFNMTILACKRDPSARVDTGYSLPGTGDPDGTLPVGWLAPHEVKDLLSQSDVVVMCAPLTADTYHMLGPAELAVMKPGAFLINVGRGATVDEEALAVSLQGGRIAGAALDVFAQEPLAAGHALYDVPNAILSPHVSGFIPSYDDKCTELFAENLRRYLAGEPLLNLVDRRKGY